MSGVTNVLVLQPCVLCQSLPFRTLKMFNLRFDSDWKLAIVSTLSLKKSKVKIPIYF